MGSKETKAAEWAVRAAILTTAKTPQSEEAHKETKDNALDIAAKFITGNSDSTNLGTNIKAVSGAIAAAFALIEGAYLFISSEYKELKSKRLSFDKELKINVATMIIPANVEQSKQSQEQKVIRLFVEIVTRHPSLAPYFGIQTAKLEDDHHSTFHSVLPFPVLSSVLPQPVGSCRNIDRARSNIHLFFDAAFTEALESIDIKFQNSVTILELGKQLIESDNYLNDLRAPRFIMMAVANLLWHLQHPVDPKTGFPLAMYECVNICREATLLINQLLNKNDEPFLLSIDEDNKKGLVCFLHKIEIHIKSLYDAYTEDSSKELNIIDLANKGQAVVMGMITCIMKMVKRKDPVTHNKKSDEKAGKKLAELVSYLNLLIESSPHVTEIFIPYLKEVPTVALVNQTPTTVMDIIIIYCHLSSDQKKSLDEKLEKKHEDGQINNYIWLAQHLRKLHKMYMCSIKDVCREELNPTFLDPKSEQIRILAARRLITLVAFVIDIYRVPVDTVHTLAAVEETTKTTKAIARGVDQVQFIIASAIKGNEYYQLPISAFIKMNEESEKMLDNLPKKINRINQASKLLRAIAEIIDNYRTFLRQVSFKEFLKDSLRRVKEEFEGFESYLKEIDRIMNRDETITRDLFQIIGQMSNETKINLDSFEKATAHFQQVVSAPDFTEQQKLMLQMKLTNLENLYKNLFHLQLNTWGFANDDTQVKLLNPIEHRKSNISTIQIIALTTVVENCYQSLSYQSKFGHKGLLLKDLITIIRQKEHNMSPENFKDILIRAMKITASYRPNYFNYFQADYGKTKSMTALIKAIQNPEINKVLPFNELLFGRGSKRVLAECSEAELQKRLIALGIENNWQQNVTTIERKIAII